MYFFTIFIDSSKSNESDLIRTGLKSVLILCLDILSIIVAFAIMFKLLLEMAV